MWKSYLLLSVAALLPVITTVIFFYLGKIKLFKNLPYWPKQIIIGVVFGGLAIVGTHWGIPFNGAAANARDAAVIIAGLIFGAPAGLIAGTIGGVERLIVGLIPSFGLGFTVVACSVSTFLAGVVTALLKKFIFKDTLPKAIPSLFIGLVVETFHLLMVFVTNANQYQKGYLVIQLCSLPMIIANSLAVLIAILVYRVLSFGKNTFKKPDNKSLTMRFTFSLSALTLIVFMLSTTFVIIFENNMSQKNTQSLLTACLTAVKEDNENFEETTLLSTNVGEKGIVVAYDANFGIVSKTKDDIIDASNTNLITNIKEQSEDKLYRVTIGEEDYFYMFSTKEDTCILSILPVSEAKLMQNISIYINTFIEIIVFGLFFVLIYYLVKRLVIDRIENTNDSLKKIINGQLDVVLPEDVVTEFNELGSGINDTVTALKGYIDAANKRIDEELALAKNIQTAVLPSTFPAFPDHKEFDIFASMHPAKQVGGDFYDFYFSNSDTFHFTIADVSGKGIPAALFMMRAKSVLKSLTQANLPINEVFVEGNNALCDGNEAQMFVTAWSSTINLKDGTLSFANGGHNPPLIKHVNGKFEFIKSPINLVLAAMDGMPYIKNEMKLQPGDIVYLYTDGVTEGVNNNNEQFGEPRLQETLNAKEFESCKELCEFVYDECVRFADGAAQFDDITMVAFKYNGPNK